MKFLATEEQETSHPDSMFPRFIWVLTVENSMLGYIRGGQPWLVFHWWHADTFKVTFTKSPVLATPVDTRIYGCEHTVLLLAGSPEREQQGADQGNDSRAKAWLITWAGKITRADPEGAKIRWSGTFKFTCVKSGT